MKPGRMERPLRSNEYTSFSETFTAFAFEPVNIVFEPLTTKASAGEYLLFAMVMTSHWRKWWWFHRWMNLQRFAHSEGYSSQGPELPTELKDLFLVGKSCTIWLRVEETGGREGR